MPHGFSTPVRTFSPSIRGALAGGAATGIAASLLLTGVGPAQASHGAEEFEQTSNSRSIYPAPGQPLPDIGEGVDTGATTAEKADGDLRIATLNADLAGSSAEDLLDSLQTGRDDQAQVVAETAQLNAPDVLVLTGISYDEDQQIAETLNEQYLAQGQSGQDGLDYPHVYTAGTNSGLDSGADLDGDGQIGGPGDAYGYGDYSGEHGMAVFSAHPIAEDEVRTFQDFLWDDMPQNSMPASGYSDLEQSIMRLNCATFWDVPVETADGDRVHLLATTKPEIGDDVEPDVNRGDDQRRLVSDYVSGSGGYIYDDEGTFGGLEAGSEFVVVGQPATIRFDSGEDLSPLVNSAVMQDPQPEAVTEQALHTRAGSAESTAGTATRAVDEGRDVRASYILPSNTLGITQSGVFWPGRGEFGYELVNPAVEGSLDDRLVWLDVDVG